MRDVMTAMPIGMLDSLVLTIGYRLEYGNRDNFTAEEVPEAKTTVVHSMYLEKFLEEASMYLGNEEHVNFDKDEECELLSEFIESHSGFCPYIINAMFIDYMGACKVIDVNADSPFPSAFDRG